MYFEESFVGRLGPRVAAIVENHQIIPVELGSETRHVAALWTPGHDINAEQACLFQYLLHEWTACKPAMVALAIEKKCSHRCSPGKVT